MRFRVVIVCTVLFVSEKNTDQNRRSRHKLWYFDDVLVRKSIKTLREPGDNTQDFYKNSQVVYLGCKD